MRQTNVFIALLLVAATLFVYWQVQHHEFTNYDEVMYVTENPRVRQGLTWDNLRYAFTESKSGYWHPLTWLSLMADSQLFLGNAGGYHWTSLLIHIANTILLFFILSVMTKAPWQSGLVAALFAFHPLHVEAVAWIAARKDVLSGFFWMLALGAYAFYVKKPTIHRYFLVLLAYVLGMMAKPTVVTLPAVLLLLDYWPLQSSRPPANGDKYGFLARVADGKGGSQTSTLFILLEKIPLALLAVMIGLISIFPEGNANNLVPLDTAPLLGRLQHALTSYMNYLIKTFWPINLTAFYPYPAHLHLWKVFMAAGLLLIVSLLAFFTRKKHPYLAVGWAWYLVTLLPVIGLVNVWTHDIADRYTYLPLLGIFIMLAWGIPELVSSWLRRRVILASLASVCLAVLLVLARQQVSYWQDSYTLWNHAVEVTNGNWLAHNNLGLALTKKGKPAEAAAHFGQAIRLMPRYHETYNNLGALMAAQGRLAEAESYYKKALTFKPDYAAAHNNLGILFAAQGKSEEAFINYRIALSLNLDSFEVHYNLGRLLAEQGKLEKAAEEYRQAIRLSPGYAAAYNNYGITLARQSKPKEAVVQFTKALSLKPDYADAHNNLGISLVQQGKCAVALSHFLEAVRIKSDEAQFHFNAGLAFQQLGDDLQALKYFTICLSLDKDFGAAKSQLNLLTSRPKKRK